MEPRRTRRVRPGVLISLAAVAVLLWWSASEYWWSAEDVKVDVPDRNVGLSGFGGLWWTGAMITALTAWAVATLPFPGAVRRVAVGTGWAASAVAVAAYVELAGKVLEHDARAHRAWAPLVWADHTAGRTGDGRYDSVADTAATGFEAAMAATFLLLVAGLVLTLPARHERTVLIGAALTTMAGGVLLPVSGWVTTGPGEATRIWIGLPGHFDERPVAVVGAALAFAFVAGGLLIRPRWTVDHGVSLGWSLALGVLWVFPAVAFNALISPRRLTDAFDFTVPPADEGVRLNTLIVLALVLPAVFGIRVGVCDNKEDGDIVIPKPSRAARRAAARRAEDLNLAASDLPADSHET